MSNFKDTSVLSLTEIFIKNCHKCYFFFQQDQKGATMINRINILGGKQSTD